MFVGSGLIWSPPSRLGGTEFDLYLFQSRIADTDKRVKRTFFLSRLRYIEGVKLKLQSILTSIAVERR